MPNCAICKKSVTTGIVLCGHCAKGLAPYTLPADLAWFIDQLSEEIVLDIISFLTMINQKLLGSWG